MENRFSELWDNRNWKWPKTDIHCWRHMNRTLCGPFVIREVSGFLPKEKRNLIIQAGGNCGMFPYEYAKFFKRVITFEPDPLNFKCLTANIDSMNVIPIQGCLGKVSGQVLPVRRSKINIGATHISKAPPTFHAQSFAIDDLHLKPDVIHLDVEGYELEVLTGAIKTIETCKPLIISEIKPEKRFDFWEFLRDFSYVETGVLSNGDYTYAPRS